MGAIALLALLGAGAFLLLGGDDEDESGLPDGAVAFVEEAPDGSVSAEELDRSRVQVASTQGLDEVPPEGSEPRVYVDGAALSDLLLDRWVRGEAAERDIEVSDDDVTAEIERVVEREFDGDESSFEDFLSENGFSEEEARNRIELQILSERIQEEVLGDEEGDARTDAVTAFQEEFFARWRARTICAEEIAIDRCSNGPEVADPEGEAPQPQPGEPQPQPGEPEPQPGE